MRIVMISGSLSRRAGGLFWSVRRLSQALANAGADVHVLGLRDPDTAEDMPEWAPLEPVVLDGAGPAALGYAPALAQEITARAPDIVHLHGIWLATSIATARWAAQGKPVMISPRGMLDPWAMANSRLKKRLAWHAYERTNLHRATCLHALNDSEARSIRAVLPKVTIATIPNGMDLPSDIIPVPRPAFLPDDGRKTLLFIGRIHPKKGILELLEAFSQLKNTRPGLAAQWRIVIAGWDDGGHKNAVARSVAERGLVGDVVFPGPLYGTDKDAVLRHADAFVLPSHSEGLPMAVLEAWAYGLPVLMTDACNLAEGFAAGAAYRIRLGPDVFLADLTAALSARDLAARGEAGRPLVAERFGWAEIAQRHEKVYRTLCEGAA